MTLGTDLRGVADPRTGKQTVVLELPDIEFIFEAQVSVEVETWMKFAKRLARDPGPDLVKIHEAAGLKLVNSLATMAEGKIAFFNYWRLGIDANALARAEIAMSDDLVFAEFDKLVQRDETKHLLCRIKTVSPARPAGFDRANSQYLRIQYDVQPRNLEEFMARLEAHVPSSGKAAGWTLGTSFSHHTGRGGRIVQLWLVPKTLTLPEAEAVVKRMPWLWSIKGEPLLREGEKPLSSLHDATPFDPYATGASVP